MILSFDVDVAKEVGTDEAVIFYNFCFWIRHNQANEKNFFDGKYWTYNSRKALLTLFPHLTESKVKTCLSNLEKKGFIVKGNYNKSTYDRTTWFAIGENPLAKRVYENSQCIGENYPMERTDLSNVTDETIQPIPDIKTNNYKDTSSLSGNKGKESNKINIPYQELLDLYHEVLPMLARIRVYNDRRKKLVAKIWKMADDYKHFESKEQGLAFFRKYFESCARSNILTGNSSLNWQADFEFIFTEKCFLDKLENGKKYR